MQKIFTINTNGAGLYEFTDDVRRWIQAEGLVTLFVQHTSASLLIQENADPEVKDDLNEFFNRLVPDITDASMSYLRHTYEGPDDMPAHIKSSLLPSHLSIPISKGEFLIGRWQGIYRFEHRNIKRTRHVIGHISMWSVFKLEQIQNFYILNFLYASYLKLL